MFQSLTVSAVRTVVSRHASEAGMEASRRSDLVLAVSEVASNSVLHADGWGALRVWREDEVLVCEVSDKGRPDRPLLIPTARDPEVADGYGLWLASQLCDRVEVRSSAGGTVVRVHMALEGS